MKKIIFKQVAYVDTHWIWQACNYIITLANQYNIDCNYISEKMDDGYYKIVFEIPENDIIIEVIHLYFTLHLPELTY